MTPSTATRHNDQKQDPLVKGALFLFFLLLFADEGLAERGIILDGGAVAPARDGLLGDALGGGDFVRDLVERHLQRQRVVITFFGVFLEQLQDEVFQPDRTIERLTRDPRGLLFEMGKEHLGRRRSDERGLTGQHLEHHAAQGVQVGLARNGGFPRDLFGSHVGVGADGPPGRRQRGRLCVASNSKVAEFKPAVFSQKQVGRLEIAMDDAVVVGVFKCQGDLARLFDRLFPGISSLLLQQLFDAATVHVFHGVEVLRLVLAPAIIADDVVVAELAEDGHFALEAANELLIGRQLRRQHLHGHQPAVFQVCREIHDTHSADAELPFQLERADAALGLALRFDVLAPLFVQAAPRWIALLTQMTRPQLHRAARSVHLLAGAVRPATGHPSRGFELSHRQFCSIARPRSTSVN